MTPDDDSAKKKRTLTVNMLPSARQHTPACIIPTVQVLCSACSMFAHMGNKMRKKSTVALTVKPKY